MYFHYYREVRGSIFIIIGRSRGGIFIIMYFIFIILLKVLEIWQGFEKKMQAKSAGHDLQKMQVDKARLAVLHIIKKMKDGFEALQAEPEWTSAYYTMKNELEWKWESEKDAKMEEAPAGVVPALKRPIRLELQDWLWTIKYGDKAPALKATEHNLETNDLGVVQDRLAANVQAAALNKPYVELQRLMEASDEDT